jgi:ATP-dependent DNA helicase DinG
VVLILDSRVVRKGYGRLFLKSLPDVPIVKQPQAELLKSLEAFLDRPQP